MRKAAEITEIKATKKGEIDFVVGRYYLHTSDKNTIIIEKITNEAKMSYIHARHLTGLNKGKSYSAPEEAWRRLALFGSIISHPFMNL